LESQLAFDDGDRLPPLLQASQDGVLQVTVLSQAWVGRVGNLLQLRLVPRRQFSTLARSSFKAV